MHTILTFYPQDRHYPADKHLHASRPWCVTIDCPICGVTSGCVTIGCPICGANSGCVTIDCPICGVKCVYVTIDCSICGVNYGCVTIGCPICGVKYGWSYFRDGFDADFHCNYMINWDFFICSRLFIYKKVSLE